MWTARPLGSCNSPAGRRYRRGSVSNNGAAVHAALALPWSSGPVEGPIHEVKVIKQSAYGRMNPDLLRQQVLHAA